MQRSYSFSTDVLPVPDALFVAVIKSQPQEAAAMVGTLSEPVRARLALFLNARAHLRHLGHAIADTCSDVALMREGGQAGLFLSDRATRDNSRSPSFARAERRVTLAEAASFAAATVRP